MGLIQPLGPYRNRQPSLPHEAQASPEMGHTEAESKWSPMGGPERDSEREDASPPPTP